MDFPKLKARFDWMKKYGHAFRTAISVHQKNFRDVEEIFQWCVDNDYPRPQWLETHPIGRALCNKDILLTPDRVDEVFGIFKRCMDRFTTSSSDQDEDDRTEYFSIDTIKFCQRLEQATNQDKAGRSLVYVASNGNVYPNSNAMSNGDFLAGSLYDNSFADVWENGFRTFRAISFDQFKGCADCPVAKKGIWCQFRCPSLSKNITGDALTCGATDYLKEFMLRCDEYWTERERMNVGLRL
jgi:MoaA/NifB/PqqE/SkfB family radical SAM enzyme